MVVRHRLDWHINYLNIIRSRTNINMDSIHVSWRRCTQPPTQRKMAVTETEG